MLGVFAVIEQSLWSFVEADAQKLNRRLGRLGIESIAEMEYEKYLRSTLWKKIREWVLRRDDAACSVCHYKHYNPNKDGMEIHHRDYDIDTLEGRNDLMLVTLCPRCHNKIEHYPDGARRTSLCEKDHELHRLTKLHQSIVENGLLLDVVDISTSRRKKLQLRYSGSSEYKVFYTLEEFASGLLINYWSKHSDHLRLPLPFSREKFYQKSGASVINKKSNEKELIANIHDDVVELSQPVNSLFDITSHLGKYIESEGYWKRKEGTT